MAWFTYEVSHLSPDAARQVLSVPGVTIRNRVVTVHENAAWLVERNLQMYGIRWSVRVIRPDAPPLADFTPMLANGLRDWVPGFLTSYQREGILSMAHRDGHLWWAAGSGKTAGAIVWALAKPGVYLLVTRAGVRRSHAREVERLTTHRALVIESRADALKLQETEATFVVVSWEMLPDLVEPVLAWKPSAVIFDEAHKAKSHRRFRATPGEDGRLKFDALDNIAQAAYRVSRSVARRLATTATPVKDRVRDLWAQLDIIHPDAWGPFYREDRASFAGQYCSARRGNFGGVDSTGSSNLDELWDRVSLVTHHVPHSVTHRSLPPRRRVVSYVPPEQQVKAAGFTQGFFKKAAKAGPGAILEARLMEAAAKKREALMERVEEAVACGQKVIVFTGRREDCDRLADDVTKAVGANARVYSGHGGTSSAVRDATQQQYMNDAGPAVLVGTGDAWGEGYNLQDTDLLLIAMLPVTPGAVVQWEGRVARHGQKRPVLVEYLVAEGTVDEHVAEILLKKLPAVEDVARDDSVQGFADQLRGSDDEESILASIMDKLGAKPVSEEQ